MALRLAAYAKSEVIDTTGHIVAVYEPLSYVIYEATEMVGNSGQASAYNWWRDQFALYMLGSNTETIKAHPEEFYGQPFFEIITYPDNKGTFGNAMCRKLAVDFVNPVYVNRAIHADSTGGNGFKAGYDKWMSAFVYAATKGGYLTFGMPQDAATPALLTESASGFLVPEPISNEDQLRMRERMEKQAHIIAPKSEVTAATPVITPVKEITVTQPEAINIEPQTTETPEYVAVTPVVQSPVVKAAVAVPAQPITEPVVATPVESAIEMEQVPIDKNSFLPGDIVTIKFMDAATKKTNPVVATFVGFTQAGDLRLQTPHGPVVIALSDPTLATISLITRHKVKD